MGLHLLLFITARMVRPLKKRYVFQRLLSKEGGSGASVRGIPKSDNRGSGSSIGNQLRKYPDGTKYRIRITDK